MPALSHSDIKNFAVFGDPVAHSRSPVMHSAAFRAMGLPHRYTAFHVRPDSLGDALSACEKLGFRGLNLTVPHKRAVLDHVDHRSERVRRIGAANTLHFVEGQRRVDNTDGLGFVAALAELGDRQFSRATILGTGGASVAIVDGLLEAFPDLKINWVSRQPGALVREGTLADPRIRFLDYAGLESLATSGEGLGGLLVNATTVGMKGGPEQFPVALPLDALDPKSAVVDVVYPRPAGGLLDRVEQLGHAVQDGLPMLLWQGVKALSIWLDREIPETAILGMRSAISD